MERTTDLYCGSANGQGRKMWTKKVWLTYWADFFNRKGFTNGQSYKGLVTCLDPSLHFALCGGKDRTTPSTRCLWWSLGECVSIKANFCLICFPGLSVQGTVLRKTGERTSILLRLSAFVGVYLQSKKVITIQQSLN